MKYKDAVNFIENTVGVAPVRCEAKRPIKSISVEINGLRCLLKIVRPRDFVLLELNVQMSQYWKDALFCAVVYNEVILPAYLHNIGVVPCIEYV